MPQNYWQYRDEILARRKVRLTEIGRKKRCKQCGKPFYQRPDRIQTYCSRLCHYKAAIKPRFCKFCKLKFTPERPGRCLCSLECRQRYVRRGRYKKCCNCKQEFYKPPSVDAIYCSKKCQIEHKYGWNTLQCDNCHKGFTRRKSTRKFKTKFCSATCMRTYFRKHRHPSWRGERKGDRGPDWRVVARKARKRDSNTCQVCGKKEEFGKRLNVDHIIPYRIAKSIPGKNPNDPVNLISLCRSCHSKKTAAENKYLRGNILRYIQTMA